MAWGQSSTTSSGSGTDGASCSSLMDRVRRNEITDLIILPGKRFTSNDLLDLADIFRNDPHNNHCRSIQASGHAVSNEALRVFGAALGKGVLLEHLAIGDSSMGDAGLQALVDGILEEQELVGSHHRFSSLKRLDLSFKGLSWKSLGILSTVAEHFPSLEWLDLSRNTFHLDDEVSEVDDDDTSSTLLDDLPRFFPPSVTDLNLSDCQLGRTALRKICSHMANSAASGCRILRLSHNPQLQNAVFSLLTTMPCLEHLVASSCGITGGISMDETMVSSSSSSSNCRILDVSENQLTVDTIRMIARQMSHLQELNVAANPTLGVPGAMAIAQELPSLQTLDASASNIGVDGALALLHSPRQQSSPGCLTSLRLFDSQLGSEGFNALAELLQRRSGGHRFATLDVAGNGADAAAVATLIAAAAPWVDCLVVGGNEGGPAVEEAIRVAKLSYPQLDVARDVKKQR
jgi:Leucine Rich repeat